MVAIIEVFIEFIVVVDIAADTADTMKAFIELVVVVVVAVVVVVVIAGVGAWHSDVSNGIDDGAEMLMFILIFFPLKPPGFRTHGVLS